ncbi:MAG: D-hexose-6-phosphate mutarotase [Bauldia sp.]|nr:D-hexose-6-phosphate mutarotase [Bauldia sp.]
MITLSSRGGTATIDFFGGQILSYVPAGGTDLLWRTSEEHLAAAKAAGKAPRGGIPVCWPWFGPHPTDTAGPGHGLARIGTWTSDHIHGDHGELKFSTDGSNPLFPYAADAWLYVAVSDVLEVTLTTINRSDRPFVLTQGLHTYLRVGDVEKVEVLGLEKATSNKGDHTDGPLTIKGEVDRIYSPVTGPLRVKDPVLRRTIVVENAGCTEAVIWNPGSDKPDMPAGSFRNMLCVEPANAKDAPTVPPGGRARISTRIRAIPLG